MHLLQLPLFLLLATSAAQPVTLLVGKAALESSLPMSLPDLFQKSDEFCATAASRTIGVRPHTCRWVVAGTLFIKLPVATQTLFLQQSHNLSFPSTTANPVPIGSIDLAGTTPTTATSTPATPPTTILFLLHDAHITKINGGLVGSMEAALGLHQLGYHVRVAVLSISAPFITQHFPAAASLLLPYVDFEKDIQVKAPEYNIIVATYWPTVWMAIDMFKHAAFDDFGKTCVANTDCVGTHNTKELVCISTDTSNDAYCSYQGCTTTTTAAATTKTTTTSTLAIPTHLCPPHYHCLSPEGHTSHYCFRNSTAPPLPASPAPASSAHSPSVPQIIYFAQDYEPWFDYQEPHAAAMAAASYVYASNVVTIFSYSNWVLSTIQKHHKKRGIKVDCHPRLRQRNSQSTPVATTFRPTDLVIATMIRPDTPRRAPVRTLAALHRVWQKFGGRPIKIVTFGCTQDAMQLLGKKNWQTRAMSHWWKTKSNQAWPWLHHMGVLNHTQVHALFEQSDVFLDLSTWQAYGFSSQEAMLNGVVPIVVDNGGANDFIDHGINGFVVNDEDGAVEVLSRLMSSEPSVLKVMQGEAVKKMSTRTRQATAKSWDRVLRKVNK